jgi:hypothetical protein
MSDSEATMPDDGQADILRDIDHKREALAACPKGHPDRDQRASELGEILCTDCQQIGDVALINEGIEFHPQSHPDRAGSCSDLGLALYEHYKQVRDVAILDKAIELEREALSLLSPRHPDRAFSCNNLGSLLRARYEQCGDLTPLNESIELNREALALRPPGHPDRALSCNNLGALLHARYSQCGDLTQLNEAIELKRQALDLQPPGHPEHAAKCGSLATSLHSRYKQCGDLILLNEAIKLKRKALALQPPGHHDRAFSCNNLATSLHERYEQCGDLTLLNEAIKLKREAPVLRPPGHLKRSILCRQLSLSLIDYYKRTKDAALLDEVIELCGYTLEHDTSSMSSRSFVILSVLHLIPDTSHFSIAKALHYLDVSLGSEVDNIRDLIRDTSHSLSQLWNLPIIWTTETTLLLSNIYTKIIDRLPLAVGFVLNTPSRLQFLKFRHHLGTDACVTAVLASQPSTAVELLDRAHGLIWTQALHQRDPQMEGAPPELASELAGLLREIAAPLTTQLNDLSYASRQDNRHRQNTRIQVLLREVRAAEPGLERFMLGNTYHTLRKAARDHAVVVLAAGCGQAFALIMPNAAADQPHTLHLDLKLDDLQSLQSAAQEAGLRSTANRREGEEPESRLGLQKSGLHVDHKPLRVLAKIWHKIVKPVLDHLKLEVCMLITLTHARSRT